MDETVAVPISAYIPDDADLFSVKLTNTNPEVAMVDVPLFHPNSDNTAAFWNTSLNVTGLFLGNTKLVLEIVSNEVTAKENSIANQNLGTNSYNCNITFHSNDN